MKTELEDLAREYLNAPFSGPGRCRKDVLNDIIALPKAWTPADTKRLQAALEAHDLAIVLVDATPEMKSAGARYTDSYINRAGTCWSEMMAQGPGGKEFDEHLAVVLNSGKVPVPAEQPWRVGEFWSSANPKEKCLCLAQGVNIVEWAKRSDFIRWVSP